jgi:hypothetical protein
MRNVACEQGVGVQFAPGKKLLVEAGDPSTLKQMVFLQ